MVGKWDFISQGGNLDSQHTFGERGGENEVFGPK